MLTKKIYLDAERMRNKPTKAEKLLFDELTKLKLDFCSQAVLHGFIADFYFTNVKLTVEVDGPSHQRKEQKIRDVLKTRVLSQYGIDTLRVTNDAVYLDAAKVALMIEKIVKRKKEQFKRPNFKYGIRKSYRYRPRRPGSF